MIFVKVKTPNSKKFTIPMPYLFLNIGGSILTSKVFWKQLNKWSSQHSNTESEILSFLPDDPTVTKKQLRKVLRELRHHKGLELINVKSHDGTEIKVRL